MSKKHESPHLLTCFLLKKGEHAEVALYHVLTLKHCNECSSFVKYYSFALISIL
jgi:hypothetical protein